MLNRSGYKNEVDHQLNSNYYDNLDHDITDETKCLVVAQLKSIWNAMEIDETNFKYLNPNSHQIRTQVIYVLPKVHKSPPTNTKFVGMPIISGNGSPIEKKFRIYRLFFAFNRKTTRDLCERYKLHHQSPRSNSVKVT